MRAPLSWLRDYVDLPPQEPSRAIAERLTAAGLQVERIDRYGEDISGVVVAKVLDIEDLTGFNKPIRWVRLSDGSDERQVICGATNFAVGATVAYARPPARLPGGFEIGARKTYGHVSDGMICSGRELGLSDDHAGILVLPDDLELGADVVDVLGLREEVLDIALNPDRGYALSMRGVAREVATAYSLELRDPAAVDVPAATEAGYPVRIEDEAGCDRYVARRIYGVTGGRASPLWLQRRLTLAGMRPVSLVVDVTNHVMLDVGQPLHAFDHARLQGDIVVRRATAGERLTTLDDVDRALDPSDLVIADDSGPIALAGVMGGASTEIRDDTATIVLEAAHFDAESVAYTARRHRLGSEASRRFERGVDPDLPAAAAEVATALLARLGSAQPAAAITDVDARRPRETIVLDPALPGRLAGVAYPPSAVAARLRDVGCAVAEEETGFVVAPPSWRPDLTLPVDLVEEIVRLEGYDQLPSTVPSAPAGRGLTGAQRKRRQLGRALAGNGFVEVVSSPFTGGDIGDRLGLPPDDGRRRSVRLANPVSDEQPLLRTTLLPGLLETLARNVGRGLGDVAVYETGRVFRYRSDAAAPKPPAAARPSDDDLAAMDAALPEQPERVAVALTGARVPAGWWGPGQPAGWADAIEAGRLLADAVGATVTVTADAHAPFHPGRCAALHVDGELLGHAGELHPRVVEAFDLPPRTCAAEFSVDVLLAQGDRIEPASPVSAYPVALVDVAVVVAESVPAAELTAALRDGAGPLLESIDLFDIYVGPQVGDGRKSLAFRLRLRAADHTLTAAEVTAARDAAVAAAAARCDAELRAG
ncbi:MAG TPA: phenylalanine--tRNA ligase subunit beta [Mycobacteriales bacterium]|nr:phenylalanine--tRNA ligase subunit beta [Mycobacteriales bacterium]